jgi:hypothetical protein
MNQRFAVNNIQSPIWMCGIVFGSDEFLLGNDALAAPVMQEGVLERDVVLPPGKW